MKCRSYQQTPKEAVKRLEKWFKKVQADFPICYTGLRRSKEVYNEEMLRSAMQMAINNLKKALTTDGGK